MSAVNLISVTWRINQSLSIVPLNFVNFVLSFNSVIERAVFPLPPPPSQGDFNFWFNRFLLVNKDPETFTPFQSQVLSLVYSTNLLQQVLLKPIRLYLGHDHKPAMMKQTAMKN